MARVGRMTCTIAKDSGVETENVALNQIGQERNEHQ
jgi:hypothetical protein